MTTPTVPRGPSRTKLWLITLLLALSTVLFVVGIAAERGWGSGATTIDTHQEAGRRRGTISALSAIIAERGDACSRTA